MIATAERVLGKKGICTEHILYIIGNRKKIWHSTVNLNNYLDSLICGKRKDQEGKKAEIKWRFTTTFSITFSVHFIIVDP